MTASQNTLKLNITLPSLSDTDLRVLLNASAMKQDKFPIWCAWLGTMLVTEIERRNSQGAEPSMPEVPSFTGRDFSDVLLGSFVFSRYPFTDSQHKFLDDIAEHITAAAAGVIEHHLPDTRL